MAPSARLEASPGYRADVDGLRAVAVLAVLAFHLGLGPFGGGYVGVDVFFVISGYLITGLVRREIREGRFTLAAFYLRRVRRLAPALLVTSAASVVGAWFVLFPEDMRSFAVSLSLQPLSLQNFFFLADGEYFRGAETKPLLHTWSLAVEEQFYLFWPLLLLGLARLKHRTGWFVLGTLFLGSFALNLAFMRISPKVSFFMLPPRAWELGIGALLAILEESGLWRRWPSRVRYAVGAAGLAAIALAVVAFGPATLFPGIAAIVPVVGAAMYIAAGCAGPHPVAGLLSHPAVVHVGLISYPLYLWHWPVLVLAGYGRAPQQHGLAFVAGVVIVTWVLAEATYRLVEVPIRERRFLPGSRALLLAASGGALLLAMIGVHFYATLGASYRYAGNAKALLTAPFYARTERCGLSFRAFHPLSQVCALQSGEHSQRILLWGNSHADMWSGLFTSLANEHSASVYLNARNCRATPDNAFCDKRVQREVLDFIASEEISDVVLISSWHGRYRVPDDVFERELANVAKEILALRADLWLVISTPSGKPLDPLVAFRVDPQAPQFGSVPALEERRRRERERQLFERLAAGSPRVHILDPSSAFCDDRVCLAGADGVAWYRDGEHLTDAGCERARGSFAPIFAKALAEH